MRTYRTVALILILCLLCAACATPRGSPGSLRDIQPGEKPDLVSDEAGLWMYMERLERKLATSGRIVNDVRLTSYIRGIICRLCPEYCNDIRFYVIETPHFNASMAPNGFMQIWTGLLLRAQNEAQLATVIGHEIGHYLRRHSVQQWRNVKNTSDVLAFFQLATASAGVGYAGDLAQLIALGTIFKFSRDQEREADNIGLAFMMQGGYDPQEGAKIWETVIAEKKASETPEQFIFFSTHPTSEERIKTLRDLADKLVAGGKGGEIHQEEYLTIIRPFRATWLHSEIQKQDFKATQVVLDRIFEAGDNLAELYFSQGEMHRIRGEENDADMAIANYQKALGKDNSPPETYRSLGLVYWRVGKHKEARKCFEQYLQVNSDASDHQIIKAYIEELD